MMPGIRTATMGARAHLRYPDLSAGSISAGSHTSSQINATATAATGGSGSYTYQWYGDSSAISGATSLTLSWTGRAASTAYNVHLVATDAVSGLQVTYSTVQMTTEADAGEVTPDILIDFSGYASTSALLNDTSTFETSEDFYNGGPNEGSGDITLDTTQGYGDSDRCMLMSWDGSGTLSRWVPFGVTATEYAAEWVVKFATDFTLGTPSTGDCALKFFEMVIVGDSGRFGYGFGNGNGQSATPNVEGPDSSTPSYEDTVEFLDFNLSDVVDGQWHVYRLYISGIGTSSIVFKTWLDGVATGTAGPYGGPVDGITDVRLNANMNDSNGGGGDQRWGKVALWFNGNMPSWAV